MIIKRLITNIVLISGINLSLSVYSQSKMDSIANCLKFSIDDYTEQMKDDELVQSVKNNDDLIFFNLIKEKRDVSNYNILLLIIAIQNHNENICKLLVKNGIKINNFSTPVRSTAVINAVQAGLYSTAYYLINNGADVNACDTIGYTPLMYSIVNGFQNLTGLLIRRGADINKRNLETSPIHIAVVNNNSVVVETILGLGANVDDYDINKYTPLMYSISFGLPVETNILLKHKANVKLRNTETSPILLASAYNDLDILKLMIKNGANVNDLSDKNETPILHAMQNNNLEMAKLLLSNGADPTLKDLKGCNAKSFARYYQNRKALNLMSRNKGEIGYIPYFNSLSIGLTQNIAYRDHLTGCELDFYMRKLQLAIFGGILKRDYGKSVAQKANISLYYENIYDKRIYYYYGIEKRINFSTKADYQTGIYAGLKKTITNTKYPGDETLTEINPFGIGGGGFYQTYRFTFKLSYEYSNFNNPKYSNHRFNLTAMININWTNYKPNSYKVTVPFSVPKRDVPDLHFNDRDPDIPWILDSNSHIED